MEMKRVEQIIKGNNEQGNMNLAQKSGENNAMQDIDSFQNFSFESANRLQLPPLGSGHVTGLWKKYSKGNKVHLADYATFLIKSKYVQNWVEKNRNCDFDTFLPMCFNLS